MFIALKSRRQERVSLKLDNLAITHPILHFLGSLESSYDMLQDDQKIFFKSWLQPLEKRNQKTSWKRCFFSKKKAEVLVGWNLHHERRHRRPPPKNGGGGLKLVKNTKNGPKVVILGFFT